MAAKNIYDLDDGPPPVDGEIVVTIKEKINHIEKAMRGAKAIFQVYSILYALLPSWGLSGGRLEMERVIVLNAEEAIKVQHVITSVQG